MAKLEADEVPVSAEYIGKDGIMGFKTKHKYTVILIQTKYCYELESIEDLTSKKSFQQVIQYGSMKSVEQNWRRV